MRRNDVASTSFRRHVPTRFLINQCQIITFLILKYDIMENSRIELRGIVLPVQVGGLLGGGGGGGQRVCWPPPPSQIIGGGAWPPWPPLFLRLCIHLTFLLCSHVSSDVSWFGTHRGLVCKYSAIRFVSHVKRQRILIS